MSRMKLGLFGANRPSSIADIRMNPNESSALVMEREERLAGLTPVERAAAEAMMGRSGPALAA